MSAGRMSPILARGPQLVQRDCTDAQPMSPLAHKELEQAALRKGRGTIGAVSNRLPIPQQPSGEAAAVQRLNSLEIGSFLSLSPTMQWLQVRHLSYMYCRRISGLHTGALSVIKQAQGSHKHPCLPSCSSPFNAPGTSPFCTFPVSHGTLGRQCCKMFMGSQTEPVGRLDCVLHATLILCSTDGVKGWESRAATPSK